MSITEDNYELGRARIGAFASKYPFFSIDTLAELCRQNARRDPKPSNQSVRPLALEFLKSGDIAKQPSRPTNGDPQDCCLFPKCILELEDGWRPKPRIRWPEMKFDPERWVELLKQDLPSRSSPKTIYYPGNENFEILKNNQEEWFNCSSNRQVKHYLEAFLNSPLDPGPQRFSAVTRFAYLAQVLVGAYWRRVDGSFHDSMPIFEPCLDVPSEDERDCANGFSFLLLKLKQNGRRAIGLARNILKEHAHRIHALNRYGSYRVF